ncbi:MAG: chloride channel protein, partial [Alphaproteobacteria bacterium]
VASLACQLVVGRTFGEGPLLGLADLPMPGTTGIGLAAACGVACGAAGVLYNAVILALLDLHDRFRSVPDGVKAALAAACAIPVGLFVPAALFGDEGVVMSLVHQGTAPGSPVLAALSGTVASLALLAAVKLVFTATSYASGVVGGLFAPQLVIGAALGTLIGRLAEPIAPGVHLAQVLAIAGAAAVFTASVRVPLTGIVLLLEMTGDVRNGFTIATAAGVAYLVATALRARPLYYALGSRRPPATTAVGSATADQSA